MTALILHALFFAVPARPQTPVAGSVVSSKEWKVRRGAEKEEEFIGDVRYRSGPTILTADWALFKHAAQSWAAKGRVRVQDLLGDGDIVEAQGDEAAFLQQTEKGSMTGKDGVRFLRTVREAEPDHGSARRLEWEGRNRIAAVGSLRLWGPRMLAWGDRGDYDRLRGQLTLSGSRPALLKLEGFDANSSDWTGALQGDTVTILENPRRLSADGKAKGWLDFKQKRKSPAEDEQ